MDMVSRRMRRHERRAYNRLYWDMTHFDLRGAPGRKRDGFWSKSAPIPTQSHPRKPEMRTPHGLKCGYHADGYRH